MLKIYDIINEGNIYEGGINLDNYEDISFRELQMWQKNIIKKSPFFQDMSKGIQNKINSIIPEKVHVIMTEGVKAMVKTVVFGSKYMGDIPLRNKSLEFRESRVREKIDFYKKAAAATGIGTGGGGIFLGLADFPILLSLKIKFLFEVASLYSFDVKDYRERLYILYVFQLAFSSSNRRKDILKLILNWDEYIKTLPKYQEDFDWRLFQQEYRDYMDLAKMLQIVPGIGAVVGGIANYSLMKTLGNTAINAYRIRVFKTSKM